MAISVRGNHCLLSRLVALSKLQRFNHTMVEGGLQAQFYREMGSDSVVEQGHIDISKWKKVDSRVCGITRSMISSPSWIVLKVLQSEGFEAYLVGGCVRDLLINKVPKDFDVITTAKLRQIRQQFHRAQIVGRRFPICIVHVKGSVVEVSSFETVARHAEEKEKFIFSKMPRGCDEKDINRWRNCMHRDFTINSLFFDPFVNKIYDYANGMVDLRSLKLRTLIPAQLSFKEDCARILRGLRIAARLGLSFSKETETAIHDLSSSIKSLAKSRIMMELNYMLSYGAAEPSLYLLRRFNLLEILLPFHAAYIAQQASEQSSMMLMKLFFNLDKLLACDRPSDCRLWVGLLAFHVALVNNPQDALVVWTFCSVLYHGKWKEGVNFAREHAQVQVNFVPEFSEPCEYKSDKELAEKVTQLASLVQASIDALTETDSLFESMCRFPVFPCSGLVFVPKNMGKAVAQIFNVLVKDIESYKEGRKSFKIDYHLLGKGDQQETRFVLGKVIMDTMSSGVVQGGRKVVEEKNHLNTFDYEQNPEVAEESCHIALSDLIKHKVVVKEDKKRSLSPSKPEVTKKQKLVEKKCNILEQEIAKKKQNAVENIKCQEMAKEQEVVENRKGKETAKKHQEVAKKCHLTQETAKKNQEVAMKCHLTQETAKKHQEVAKNCHLTQETAKKHQEVAKKCHLTQETAKKHQEVVREKNEKRKQLVKEKHSQLPLSSLFK